MADNTSPLWFAFHEDQLLVSREGDGTRLPEASSPEDLGANISFTQYVGTLKGRPCYAAAADAGVPEGMVYRDLRGLWGTDEEFFIMAGRAKQTVGWHETHRFCGRDGTETFRRSEELAKECPRCGEIYHPRLSPAAIVLVRRGDQILLARSPGFPEGMYSVLAGFVEPGESIEETIAREVREEVGIEVENIRYFGSQPWPFPHSLMIGFVADYAGGELKIGEPDEIEDAGWYHVDNLPDRPPKVSIARTMLDAFVAGRGAGECAARES